MLPKWNPWKGINRTLTSIPRQAGTWVNPPLSILGLVGLHVQLPDSNSLFTSPYAGGLEVPKETSPNKYTTLYDASGKRMVFYHGGWIQDDPADKLDNWMKSVQISDRGISIQNVNPYDYMDDKGNYLDPHGNIIPKGTMDWMRARWGDRIPDTELAAHPAEELSADPYEAMMLDDRAERAVTYNNQGLVKIGKPVDYGDSFYINGQRAIMGSPTAEGTMQYAVTQPGEGDRWKYKVMKDSDGNFVRTYYRSFGAVKEKAARLKEKHKK